MSLADMFTSLRARLWLSYAVLIIAALCVAAGFFVAYLLRNPLAYRQTLNRLRIVETFIASREVNIQWNDMFAKIEKAAQTFDTRIVVFSPEHNVLLDTRANDQPSVQFPTPLLRRITPVVRDAKGKPWLYVLHQMPDQNWVMVAEPRPSSPFFSFLTDELLPPFIQGGLIALLLSLAMAYFIARWVADPLQRVIVAAREMPSGQIRPIEERGPREVQDVTRAFNAMSARVQASQTSQRDFVANVSHELKTPLTSIQGFAQAIMDGTADTPDERRQAAEVIYNEAGRMYRLALDLLDLARLDTGTADITMTQLNMRALLNAIVEKFMPQAQQSGTRLVLQMPDELPSLYGDGDRLAQVFTNLVDNALKFTPPNGTIALRAIQLSNEICVSVTDSGPGISPDALPRVFDRFYQADSSRKGGKKHGAGLGLAIAREIVNAHGGRVTVQSPPNEGATFLVHLPISREGSTIKKKKR